MCRNLSLNGSSFMSSMTCSMASMHPISLGSREKTWWNSNSNATRLLSQIRQPFFEAIQPTVLLQGGKEEVLSLLSQEFNRLWPVGVFIG